MKTKFIVIGALALLAGGAFAMAKGKISADGIKGLVGVHETAAKEEPRPVSAPTVSVAKVATANFEQSAFITGSLTPREEILVAPEIEGLRVLDIKVDEGDSVRKGQVLAVLVRETLETQLAQNTASIARGKAAIAQAKSRVIEAEATLSEAKAQLKRAAPLARKGILSGAVFDERKAAKRTATAQLAAARDGVAVTEADLAQTKAQRLDIDWRLARTEIKAPTAGLISRKTARIGSMATAVGEPMFRIIQDGKIELEGEVTESQLPFIKAGLKAKIEITGVGKVDGTVRLVLPEVSRETRLGIVRISLKQNAALKIGAFARGTVAARQSRGLAVPMAAVMYEPNEKSVLRVNGDKVEKRMIKTGLQSGGLIEVVSGLVDGDVVVAKAGTFLRSGDRIKPVMATTPSPRISEAR